ncbi:alkaline phosphatase D family protein [Planctomicrobium sp. SH664]|uniref:alkaline phosphatase D family protein n=1 Tax=Planctomicrobium sp. SH664 TaxID=3448125 RepID=UPI003F5C2260
MLTRRQFAASILASPLIARTALSWSNEPAVRRIGFGSCARQTLNQQIWDVIGSFQPDQFLFIGDTVYANPTDPSMLVDALKQLRTHEAFERFRHKFPFYAVWDDHDFGVNDSGGDNPLREDSQEIFLDFFGTGANPRMREQAGIYQSFVSGPPGQRVQTIVLDTRYHRSPLTYKTVGKRRIYIPATDERTFLGEEQWKWLEQQLQVPAEVRIVASSIQVLTLNHTGEKWANIPAERTRLLNLINRTSGLTVLVSGDVHMAEVSCIQLEPGKKLFELTSSGMTHHRERVPPWSHLRVGEALIEKNFGLVELNWDNPHGVSADLVICNDLGVERIRQSTAPKEKAPGRNVQGPGTQTS